MAASNTTLAANPDYAHFAAIPWCAAQLGDAADPALVAITPWVRTPQDDGENSLWSQTLRTTRTVPFMLQFWRVPVPAAGSAAAAAAAAAGPVADVADARGRLSGPGLVGEVCLLLTLGRDIDGVAGVCHGGLVAAILDEVAGMLVEVNKRRAGALPVARPGRPATAETYMTAYLRVSYLRPVPSSASVLARARLVRVAGRKLFAEATVEDRAARVCARADVLYVALKKDSSNSSKL